MVSADFMNNAGELRGGKTGKTYKRFAFLKKFTFTLEINNNIRYITYVISKLIHALERK